MLRKLLKYEIKATARIFLPMYVLLIVFALINKFFISSNSAYLQIPRTISMMIFVTIAISICVITVLLTIQRFNKNLLGDEGYLSFTLPVKVHNHIDSKMIATLMWVLLSSIVSFISIFIMRSNENNIKELGVFINSFTHWLNNVGSAGHIIVLEVFLVIIIGILTSTVSVYAAITIGNMSSKHKLLAGVGSYLGFKVIEHIVLSSIAHTFGERFTFYLKSLDQVGAQGQDSLFAMSVLLGMIIYTFVFGMAYYFLTNWMLKNKLNIE